ncbi:ABC transporter ATP-binding protein [Alicyclobacillus sendaiensis]|uniref:ABC transporter ATP-binding protein n=1 Tax=Alicyclobacillus sendaiensis TaxID=192387 RepID=UPI0026F44483|nr:ABC transporter ATP-binding protein [Alicyclobacillus sendaiensis]
MAETRDPVLQIEDLSVAYVTNTGLVHAVSDVNLTVHRGEIVGLVGESGSGKSTMAYTIMRLLRGDAVVTKGRVRVLGQDVYALSEKELRAFRWSKMSMVFQSAMSALNPVMTVETQIVDTILAHRPDLSRQAARERAKELLDLVRIDQKHLQSYPHELSGGMRQRVVIAIAIALNPALVIMDEPTTALDVVVQRSILDEIRRIQEQVGFAILFVSHDFSLVAELASRVAIMYAGRIVELTPSHLLNLSERHHPYTEGLLKAIPQLTADEVTIQGIGGYPPDLKDLPPGCAFHPRCPYAMDVCKRVRPSQVLAGEKVLECHLFNEAEVNAHV